MIIFDEKINIRRSVLINQLFKRREIGNCFSVFVQILVNWIMYGYCCSCLMSKSLSSKDQVKVCGRREFCVKEDGLV